MLFRSEVLLQRIALEELAAGLRASERRGACEQRLEALRREYAGRRQRQLQAVQAEERQWSVLLGNLRAERRRLELRSCKETQQAQELAELRRRLEEQTRRADAAAEQFQLQASSRRRDRELTGRFIAELRLQVENLAGTMMEPPPLRSSEAA